MKVTKLYLPFSLYMGILHKYGNNIQFQEVFFLLSRIKQRIEIFKVHRFQSQFSKSNPFAPFLTEENYYSGFFLFEGYFGIQQQN